MRSKINYNHLECFFLLAKELSFSATAKKLKIAQPAVSKQIKALEETFSTQLFLRNKKQVSLTRAGQDLYDKVQPLYFEIEKRVSDVLERSEELSGTIVFGCLSEVGERVFVEPLNLFSRDNPNVTIEIRFLKGKDIVSGVKSGEIHIGIVAQSIIQENIRSYKVLDEEILLIGKKRAKKPGVVKKLLGRELSEINFVSYREDDPLLDFYIQKAYPRVRRAGISKKFRVNSHRSMVEAVKTQDLYAVLPLHSVQEEIEKGTIEDMGPIRIKSNLYLIHLELDYPEQLTKVLSIHLRKLLKND